MNKLTGLASALALATAFALPSLAGAETTTPPAAPQGMVQGDAMMGGDRTGGGTGMSMMDMMKMMKMMAGMADQPDMQMKSGDMPPKG